MKDRLDKFFYSQIKEHELVISKTKESIKDNFLNVVDICYQALKNKKKIIFFGNGGSASDAQHLSAELVGRYSEYDFQGISLLKNLLNPLQSIKNSP